VLDKSRPKGSNYPNVKKKFKFKRKGDKKKDENPAADSGGTSIVILSPTLRHSGFEREIKGKRQKKGMRLRENEEWRKRWEGEQPFLPLALGTILSSNIGIGELATQRPSHDGAGRGVYKRGGGRKLAIGEGNRTVSTRCSKIHRVHPGRG